MAQYVSPYNFVPNQNFELDYNPLPIQDIVEGLKFKQDKFEKNFAALSQLQAQYLSIDNLNEESNARLNEYNKQINEYLSNDSLDFTQNETIKNTSKLFDNIIYDKNLISDVKTTSHWRGVQKQIEESKKNGTYSKINEANALEGENGLMDFIKGSSGNNKTRTYNPYFDYTKQLKDCMKSLNATMVTQEYPTSNSDGTPGLYTQTQSKKTVSKDRYLASMQGCSDAKVMGQIREESEFAYRTIKKSNPDFEPEFQKNSVDYLQLQANNLTTKKAELEGQLRAYQTDNKTGQFNSKIDEIRKSLEDLGSAQISTNYKLEKFKDYSSTNDIEKYELYDEMFKNTIYDSLAGAEEYYQLIDQFKYNPAFGQYQNVIGRQLALAEDQRQFNMTYNQKQQQIEDQNNKTKSTKSVSGIDGAITPGEYDTGLALDETILNHNDLLNMYEQNYNNADKQLKMAIIASVEDLDEQNSYIEDRENFKLSVRGESYVAGKLANLEHTVHCTSQACEDSDMIRNKKVAEAYSRASLSKQAYDYMKSERDKVYQQYGVDEKLAEYNVNKLSKDEAIKLATYFNLPTNFKSGRTDSYEYVKDKNGEFKLASDLGLFETGVDNRLYSIHDVVNLKLNSLSKSQQALLLSNNFDQSTLEKLYKDSEYGRRKKEADAVLNEAHKDNPIYAYKNLLKDVAYPDQETIKQDILTAATKNSNGVLITKTGKKLTIKADDIEIIYINPFGRIQGRIKPNKDTDKEGMVGEDLLFDISEEKVPDTYKDSQFDPINNFFLTKSNNGPKAVTDYYVSSEGEIIPFTISKSVNGQTFDVRVDGKLLPDLGDLNVSTTQDVTVLMNNIKYVIEKNRAIDKM